MCNDASMLYDSPLDPQSGLTCQSCGIQKPQNVIDQLESDLESRLEAIKSDKNLLLEALSSHSRLLHPNHYLMIAMERYLMYLLDPQIVNDRPAVETNDSIGRFCFKVLKVRFL